MVCPPTISWVGEPGLHLHEKTLQVLHVALLHLQVALLVLLLLLALSPPKENFCGFLDSVPRSSNKNFLHFSFFTGCAYCIIKTLRKMRAKIFLPHDSVVWKNFLFDIGNRPSAPVSSCRESSLVMSTVYTRLLAKCRCPIKIWIKEIFLIRDKVPSSQLPPLENLKGFSFLASACFPVSRSAGRQPLDQGLNWRGMKAFRFLNFFSSSVESLQTRWQLWLVDWIQSDLLTIFHAMVNWLFLSKYFIMWINISFGRRKSWDGARVA